MLPTPADQRRTFWVQEGKEWTKKKSTRRLSNSTNFAIENARRSVSSGITEEQLPSVRRSASSRRDLAKTPTASRRRENVAAVEPPQEEGPKWDKQDQDFLMRFMYQWLDRSMNEKKGSMGRSMLKWKKRVLKLKEQEKAADRVAKAAAAIAVMRSKKPGMRTRRELETIALALECVKGFKGLAPNVLHTVSQDANLVPLGQGEPLFIQGDRPDAFYIVLTGSVAIFVLAAGSDLPGKKSAIDGMSHEEMLRKQICLGPHLGTRIKDLACGDPFGELGLCRVGATRAASAVGIEDGTTVLRVSAEVFTLCLASQHSRLDVHDKVRLLHSLNIFKHWKEDDVLRLAYVTHREVHRRGSLVVRQGTAATSLSFIVSGDVIVQRAPTNTQHRPSTSSAPDASGFTPTVDAEEDAAARAAAAARSQPVAVAMLRRPDVIGAEELLSRTAGGAAGSQMHLYSAVANSNVEVYRVSFDDITKLGFKEAHGLRTREMLKESMILRRQWRSKYYRDARRGKVRLATKFGSPDSSQAERNGLTSDGEENSFPAESRAKLSKPAKRFVSRAGYECVPETNGPAAAAATALGGRPAKKQGLILLPPPTQQTGQHLQYAESDAGSLADLSLDCASIASFELGNWESDLNSARSYDSQDASSIASALVSTTERAERTPPPGHQGNGVPKQSRSSLDNNALAAPSFDAKAVLKPVGRAPVIANRLPSSPSPMMQVASLPMLRPASPSAGLVVPGNNGASSSLGSRHSLASRCGWAAGQERPMTTGLPAPGPARGHTSGAPRGRKGEPSQLISERNGAQLIKDLSDKLCKEDRYAFVL